MRAFKCVSNKVTFTHPTTSVFLVSCGGGTVVVGLYVFFHHEGDFKDEGTKEREVQNPNGIRTRGPRITSPRLHHLGFVLCPEREGEGVEVLYMPIRSLRVWGEKTSRH